MSDAPPVTHSSIESTLDRISNLERQALATLLGSKKHLYGIAPTAAVGQLQRVSDVHNNSNSHEVYLVDISSVQKYLEEVEEIAKEFKKSVPQHYEISIPRADLRFLEICGSLNFPEDDEDAPFSLAVNCSIDVSYTTFKCPVEFVVLDRVNEFDLIHAKFQKSCEIQLKPECTVNIEAGNASFANKLEIRSSLKNGGKKSPHIWIKAASLDVNELVCRELIFADAELPGAVFLKKAVFHNIKFDQIILVNSKFVSGVQFSGCIFNKAPDFHGAELHPDTSFQGCYFNTSDSQLADVASFRVLKAHYAKMRDSKHELIFYALEQRSERKNLKSEFFVKFISWLYDEISDYGASIEKAVKCFLLWNLNFLIFYYLLTTPLHNVNYIKVKNQSLESYPALLLTLQNSFDPLALFSEKAMVSVNNTIVYVASLCQSFGSIAILALMLLAIRGRFRKGSGTEN